MLCNCFQVLTPREAWGQLVDEVRELLVDRSREELADVCFATGRLLGALTGRRFVYVPGSGPSWRKFEERFRQTGCIRSARNRERGIGC